MAAVFTARTVLLIILSSVNFGLLMALHYEVQGVALRALIAGLAFGWGSGVLAIGLRRRR
jgi:hypothetical protein